MRISLFPDSERLDFFHRHLGFSHRRIDLLHRLAWLPIAAVVWTCLASPLRAEEGLWQSPLAGVEVLDLNQSIQDTGTAAIATGAITAGQTFVPSQSTLLRIDFRFDNADDPRPGQIRLFRWQGSHPKTIERSPIFEEIIDLSGAGGYRSHSFFPRLNVDPDATYYVELTGHGRTTYRIAQTLSKSDAYRAGQAFKTGHPDSSGPSRDLWFRTYAYSSSNETGLNAIKRTVKASKTPAPPRTLRFSSNTKAPSFPPRPNESAVERKNYYDRIRDFADRYRENLLASCREPLFGNALREAFLYRASCESGECEERYARQALAYFQNGHSWRFCEAKPTGRRRSCTPACKPDAPVGHNSIEQPASAYLWLQDSPSLRPKDHARIKELLLDRAERLWPKREAGAHNRTLKAALGYRLVTNLYPDEPDAPKWRAYAEAGWKSFWDVRDTYEDSAHYNAAEWWPAILGYIEAAGLEAEVWSDPAFLRLVDRFAKETIPLGALPNWGDSVGWAPGPSGLIWLFEAAAQHTRRPEYRWLAHRVFAYSMRQARDEWPRKDAFYIGHYSLANAFFASDESLQAEPPSDRTETTFHAMPTNTTSRRIEPGQALGKIFTAQASPLVRINLQTRNLGDEKPARISLWRWNDSRQRTMDAPPLFQESLSSVGPDRLARRTALPFLELEVGANYYLEVERPDAPLILLAEQRTSTDTSSAALAFSAFSLTNDDSVVTDRVHAQQLEKGDRRTPPEYYEFTQERVPDKLVLRSGNDPDDLHAVFNLLSGYQHGQPEMGALVSLVDGGSVQLTSGPFPYWFHGRVRRPQDESLPLVRRYWGGDYGEPGNHVSVEHFSDTRAVTVASIQFKDPNGWQVQQERRIFFVKNRFLLVRDRFTVPSAMTVAVGPIWHSRDLAPERGDNFFDLYNRQPLSDTWRMRNPLRHLLVYFVPRPGTDSKAIEVPAYLPPAQCPDNSSARISAECRNSPPFVTFQRWVGEMQAGESRWFDTLLLPHSSKMSSKDVAKGVRVLQATDGVALEVEIGNERWLLIDNPSAEKIDTPELETDARYLVARSAPGKRPYLMTKEASQIRWREIEHRWGVSTSVEFGGDLPSKRLPGW